MSQSEIEEKIIYNEKQRIKPEFEWVQQQDDQSIRYLEHGAPSKLIRWHYHKEYELHFVKSTSGKMFVGDYIGNFSPGNLVLAGPDLPHNWISQMEEGESVPLRDQVVQFSPSFIGRCQALMPEFNRLRPLLEHSHFGVEFLDQKLISRVETLFEHMAVANELQRIVLFFQMLELLAMTDDYRILSSGHHTPLIDEKSISWLNRAVNYIFDNYDRSLTLEEMGEYMAMGETQFSKYFKKASGHRFIDFVNRMRINKACEFLAHSEMPVTEICFSVGFNNISNFNRRFFNFKGMSPSEYRKTSLSGLYMEKPVLEESAT